MEVRTIYVKGNTYSPNLIEGYESTISRIIADEGKILTNGTDKVHVLDIPNEDVSLWYEIDDIEVDDIETVITQLEGLT